MGEFQKSIDNPHPQYAAKSVKCLVLLLLQASEVTELGGARMSGRISEISRKGCYIV